MIDLQQLSQIYSKYCLQNKVDKVLIPVLETPLLNNESALREKMKKSMLSIVR